MADRVSQQLNKIKILFVAANPTSTSRLQLDEEIRAITEKIRAAEHRDLLELVSIWAVRPDDLLQSLNQHKPQVVHFSSHGSKAGEIILLDNRGAARPVSVEALKALFTTLRDNVQVVFLNACYSQPQAKAITSVIDCAVGMNNKIMDGAAIVFAASFYRAIGFGRSVQEAFDQGKTALLLEGYLQHNTPELLAKAGIDACRVVLVTPEQDSAANEGRSLLKRGQNALSRGDYASAKKDLEKVIDVLTEDKFPQEVAKANYLLALTLLDGKRPFVQTRPIMNALENYLRAAIALHSSYSYIATFAMIKLDFARNGLPDFLNQALGLLESAKQVARTSEDVENLNLLSICQPYLIKDYLQYI